MHAWSCAARTAGGWEKHFHRIVFGDLDDVEVAEAFEGPFDGDFRSCVDVEVIHLMAVDFAQNRV